MIFDPIADMFTRIRNAVSSEKDTVDVPSSNLKINIVKILAKEGFIEGYKYIEDGKQGILRIHLKYKTDDLKNKIPVINEIRRVSKPSRRIYKTVNDLPKIKGNLGVAIVSTSKGVMTAKEAKANNVGGEYIGYVY
jgi:small subunit ribosomal protein S8